MDEGHETWLLPIKANGRNKNFLTLGKDQETFPCILSLTSKSKLQESTETKQENPLPLVPGQGTFLLMEIQKHIRLPSLKGLLLLPER